MNYRLFVEKREGFRVEAESLRRELNENLQLHIRRMRYLCVYDLFGFSKDLLEQSKYSVFGERVTDVVMEELDLSGKRYLAVEYIPGQFDQRADSAAQCIQLVTCTERPTVRTATIYKFYGTLTLLERELIDFYIIIIEI